MTKNSMANGKFISLFTRILAHDNICLTHFALAICMDMHADLLSEINEEKKLYAFALIRITDYKNALSRLM